MYYYFGRRLKSAILLIIKFSSKIDIEKMFYYAGLNCNSKIQI
jgi:hypothetical protein